MIRLYNLCVQGKFINSAIIIIEKLKKCFCLPCFPLFALCLVNVSVLAQTTQTLSPVADAFVRNGSFAATNYGSDPALMVKGSPTSGYARFSYLKFSLGSVSSVASATLRIYGNNTENTSTINISAYQVNTDSWTESSITWNNAPASLSNALSTAGVNNVAKYYELDVTDFVKSQFSGDKTVSLVIKDPAMLYKNLTFNSKENAANRPQLIITTSVTPGPGETLLSPAADAFVRNGSFSATNYGSNPALMVKSSPTSGYTRFSYLKFSLGSVSSVATATLRIYGNNTENTSTINISAYGVNNDSWTESGITWNNAPASLSNALSAVGVNNVTKYYELDVTDFVKSQFSGDKTVSLVIKDPGILFKNSTFNSKESTSNRPQLVITDLSGGAPGNALLFVENPDKFPSNEHFTFSRIQIPWSRDGITFNANHDSVKVRIHNNGVNALTISNLILSNTNAWKIEKLNEVTYVPSSALPLTISSGNFADLILRFIAVDQATRVKVLHGTLTIISNDDKFPSKKVFLDGLWQKSGEGAHEPYAQEIMDAFGFKTNAGFGHTDPDLGDSLKLKGDEIQPSYFVRADASIPVTVRQMAAYQGCCYSTEKITWHAKGSNTVTTITTHIVKDGQTLLPRQSESTGAGASGSFNPTTAFGLRVGSNNWLDPAKNTGGKIGIFVWKALDSTGNIIPNSYIISNDYLGTTSTNYDYNDNMYFISNVKPEKGAAFFSTLRSTPSNLDFGEKVLQTTNSLQLNLSSLGKTYSDGSKDPAITISSVVISGENKSEFSATSPVKGILNPQENTTLTVTFKPVSQGLKIADLLIYYNNSLSPLRVPLYGIGKSSGTAVTVHQRINCGSSTAVTLNGKTWKADNQYSFDNLEPFTNSTLANKIAGTDEDALYTTEQSSNGDKKPFRYEIPVANGNYVVRLHFAEIFWGAPGSGLSGGAGSRVMSVKLENQLRLINFDVFQEVGGATVVIKNLPVTVSDGELNIDFSATVNRPMVNALEVYSFSSSLARPVNNMDSSSLSSSAINENAFEKPRLFPNPLHDRFLIEFPRNYEGVYTIQIIDLLGKKYEVGKTILKRGGSTINMDISKFHLQAGIYLLKIHSDTGKTEVNKLIIQ